MGNQFLNSIKPILIRELNSLLSMNRSTMVESFPFIDASTDSDNFQTGRQIEAGELESLTLSMESFDEKLKFIEKIWSKAFSIIESYMIIGINESKLKKTI
jgi:hypothetical protein